MAEVRWTEQATDDLEAACSFIARDAPRYAESFANRVVQATERLSQFPRSGRIVPELEHENLREVIVQSYRVIYRLREGVVEIVTVHHGARLLDTLNE